jgi:hypothetical protein
MSYDNRNSGIITRNDKQGYETRPDYRGSINVEGRDYWISCWIKTGRDGTKLAGQKYMSLSVKPKDDQYSASSGSGSGPYDASGSARPYGTGEYGSSRPVSPAAPQPARQAAPKASGTGFDEMDDDMPF